MADTSMDRADRAGCCRLLPPEARRYAGWIASEMTLASRITIGRRQVAGGVTAFGPDPGTLLALIEAVAPSVHVVLVFVNGYADEALVEQLRKDSRVQVLYSERNQGVGHALNQIVDAAALSGCDSVVLFDQDSRPRSDVLPLLMASAQALRRGGQKPAAVGPKLHAQTSSTKQPRYFERKNHTAQELAVPVHYLPTSGTLISIDAFREIGPFRGDYFIDGIDLEWCFRAWAKGYSCWLATNVTMEHTVGDGSVGAFGFRTPQQKEFRLETYVRNTIYGFRLPHISFSWKLRQAAYLAAQVALFSIASGFRPSLMKRFGRGIVNGIRGRLGPPDGVPFT
jgi:rhamnosyltransferase